MHVGELLVAVENAGFMPSGNDVRSPQKLIVEARVIWLTSGFIHLRLPEVDILYNGARVRLPATTLKLPRLAAAAPGREIRTPQGGTAEWPRQPFYRPLKGKRYTAALADYYPREAWHNFESHLAGARPQRPIDPERRRLAAQLGVEADADRQTVNAAFRLKIKDIHPDVGGDPEAFQNLVQIRNALLSYVRA